MGEKPQWKKMQPKEARGIFDPDLKLNDARRENRDLRKRMARRLRRISKQDLED